MTTRTASCRCGALTARCEGEPVRVSACHCLACQQRTGSAFSVQARFLPERIAISGESHQWSRVGDEGHTCLYHFCPHCGSTVFYMADDEPELVAVPVGAFANPDFPPPTRSVYEQRRHRWTGISGDGVEHWD